LCFWQRIIATDAKIPQSLLQECLSVAVEQSFNRITVDGDTSTNDACVLMASGKSSLPEITVGSEAMQQFQQAIQNKLWGILASVAINPSIVAILGWIMPAPLDIPEIVSTCPSISIRLLK
jgi:hypothetical protein